MNSKPDEMREFPGLPGVRMRHISLEDRTVHDRHFIPSVKDFGVASTLEQIEEAVSQASQTSGDVLSAFLQDVAETKRELLSESPDQGKICVGLTMITRFLNGAIKGNLLPATVVSQVPSWVQRIKDSYTMLFFTFQTEPDSWIEFLNSHFGHEHRVRAISEFDGIEKAT